MDILKPNFHSSLLGTMDYLYIVNRVKIPSIPAGGSNVVGINVATTKGMVVQVKSQCASTNYDLHVLPFETVDIDKEPILIIFSSLQSNKVINQTGLSLLWTKYSRFDDQRNPPAVDEDTALYLKIINNDAVATGDIYVEIAHQVFE